MEQKINLQIKDHDF